MSRLSALRQLDTANPAALKRDLGRLVALLEEELNDLRSARSAAFPDGVYGPTIAIGRPPFALGLGRIHIIDMAAGDVDVWLPVATSADEGSAVGIVRVQAGNTLTLHASGGQLVSGSPYVGVGTEGLRIVFWCGGAPGNVQRGWRFVT